MPGIVVPYERFVEIRQLRRRVTAKLAEQSAHMVSDAVVDDRAGAVDLKPLNDEQCGTQATLAEDAPKIAAAEIAAGQRPRVRSAAKTEQTL
jgi:hypothetical protein